MNLPSNYVYIFRLFFAEWRNKLLFKFTIASNLAKSNPGILVAVVVARLH